MNARHKFLPFNLSLVCIYMFRHHVHNTIQLRLFLFYCKQTKNAVGIEKTISNDYDTVKLQRRSTQGECGGQQPRGPTNSI
jgi:hypothetical protein